MDPLLSSSMRQASFKCEMPRLELKSSRSFLAIKRFQWTKSKEVINRSRSSLKSWAHIRLIDLKHHIDYFSKGQKLSRTNRTQKRRSFQVNSILSFCHNDKHEMQHVGQLISIKGTLFNSVPFYAYQPDMWKLWPMGPSRVPCKTHLPTNALPSPS